MLGLRVAGVPLSASAHVCGKSPPRFLRCPHILPQRWPSDAPALPLRVSARPAPHGIAFVLLRALPGFALCEDLFPPDGERISIPGELGPALLPPAASHGSPPSLEMPGGIL